MKVNRVFDASETFGERCAAPYRDAMFIFRKRAPRFVVFERDDVFMHRAGGERSGDRGGEEGAAVHTALV